MLQILVVGGSFDNAAPSMLASQASYLLDLSRPGGLTWQPEATATPRVMPDAVLLPDGTVLVVNGANYGTAGRSPGWPCAFSRALAGAPTAASAAPASLSEAIIGCAGCLMPGRASADPCSCAAACGIRPCISPGLDPPAGHSCLKQGPRTQKWQQTLAPAAGGLPTAGSAANLEHYGARRAEIYNPTNALGQRWSGLLADSQVDRLAHSTAFLTLNGEVRTQPVQRDLWCLVPL